MKLKININLILFLLLSIFLLTYLRSEYIEKKELRRAEAIKEGHIVTIPFNKIRENINDK